MILYKEFFDSVNSERANDPEATRRYQKYAQESQGRFKNAIVCTYMRMVAGLHRRGEVSRDDAVNAIYRVKVLNNLA